MSYIIIMTATNTSNMEGIAPLRDFKWVVMYVFFQKLTLNSLNKNFNLNSFGRTKFLDWVMDYSNSSSSEMNSLIGQKATKRLNKNQPPVWTEESYTADPVSLEEPDFDLYSQHIRQLFQIVFQWLCSNRGMRASSKPLLTFYDNTNGLPSPTILVEVTFKSSPLATARRKILQEFHDPFQTPRRSIYFDNSSTSSKYWSRVGKSTSIEIRWQKLACENSSVPSTSVTAVVPVTSRISSSVGGGQQLSRKWSRTCFMTWKVNRFCLSALVKMYSLPSGISVSSKETITEISSLCTRQNRQGNLCLQGIHLCKRP